MHEERDEEDIGAGDQGLMFGYATDETEDCMPLTVDLAHGLNRRLAECRRRQVLPWLRPDTKTQVRCSLGDQNWGHILYNVLILVLYSDSYSTSNRAAGWPNMKMGYNNPRECAYTYTIY